MTDVAETWILQRLEANVRAVAARGRDVVGVGPFQAFLATDSQEYLLSLATPTRQSDAWSSAIERLDAAFASRGLRPRLEFFHERYPDLAAALASAGYGQDSSAPAMVLRSEWWRQGGNLVAMPIPGGLRFSPLSAEDPAVVGAFLAMQSRAYGVAFDAVGGAWRERLLADLRGAEVVGGALLDGRTVVSGAVLMLGGGCAELAGVATEPDFQGRGYAARACAALLELYFATGRDLCWLSAAEGAEGLYRRLGFRTVGTQRNFGRLPTA